MKTRASNAKVEDASGSRLVDSHLRGRHRRLRAWREFGAGGGKVTLNNKPLADASVVFSPARGNGPGPFVATTNTEGRFALGPVGKPGGGAAAAITW